MSELPEEFIADLIESVGETPPQDEGIVTLILLIIFFILGAVCVLRSIYDLIKTRSIERNGEHTSAILVKTEKEEYHRSLSGVGPDRKYYYLTLKYVVNGAMYEIRHFVGGIDPKLADGELLEIIYDKNNHEKIIIGNRRLLIRSTIRSLVGVFAGLFFIFISIVIYML